jgi:hypothetical protein
METHSFIGAEAPKHQSTEASKHLSTKDSDWVRTTFKITPEHAKKLKQSALDTNKHVYEILQDALIKYFKE